ncbi:hypothetical protein QTO34_005662 [Cnephaeus nilssonii]|uniref:Gamma-retroviral matrix protein domain-containing protein n=1 Tax=Cnephaeus nilssonii TaxID=3371016 RepID=A0AA40HNS8_CNENI|nr:hypothetical protein QTO34_005662 [Eptesicus nilssonii]
MNPLPAAIAWTESKPVMGVHPNSLSLGWGLSMEEPGPRQNSAPRESTSSGRALRGTSGSEGAAPQRGACDRQLDGQEQSKDDGPSGGKTDRTLRRASHHSTCSEAGRKFCEREWLTFPYPSKWPPEGSTDLGLAYNIQRAIFDNPDYPDQIPYIQIWIDIFTDNPKWLWDCKRPPQNKEKLGQRWRRTILFTKPPITKPPPSETQGKPAAPALWGGRERVRGWRGGMGTGKC